MKGLIIASVLVVAARGNDGNSRTLFILFKYVIELSHLLYNRSSYSKSFLLRIAHENDSSVIVLYKKACSHNNSSIYPYIIRSV